MPGGCHLGKISGLLKSLGCFAGCNFGISLDAGSSTKSRLSHGAELIAAEEESRPLLLQPRARRALGKILGLSTSLSFFAVWIYNSGSSSHARIGDVRQVAALNPPPTQGGDAGGKVSQDAEDEGNSIQCPTPLELGGSSEVNHDLLGGDSAIDILRQMRRIVYSAEPLYPQQI